MSDVPLASSLSGGLDSAIITAIVSKDHALDTYTLGFSGEFDGDERPLSKQLANKYGTRHHEIEISPDDLLSCVDDILLSCDAPYGGGIPTWFIMNEVSGKQKVIFNGLGGDELFGNHYKWMRYESLPGRLMYLRRHLAYGESLSEICRFPNGSIYNKYLSENMKQKLLLDFGDNSLAKVEQLLANCPSKSWRDRIPYIDFSLQLPEEFLMMVDRFSMNFSVEARTPFWNRELVEKC